MPSCSACKDDKPEDQFPWKNRALGRRQTKCLPCCRRYSRLWYERNKQKHGRRVQQWKLKNPDRRRANNANYRARKQLATLKLSPEHTRQIQEIYQRAWKLTEKTGVVHHVDHLVPLNNPTVCGLHVPWNLQILPDKLNIKKRNQLTLDS